MDFKSFSQGLHIELEKADLRNDVIWFEKYFDKHYDYFMFHIEHTVFRWKNVKHWINKKYGLELTYLNYDTDDINEDCEKCEYILPECKCGRFEYVKA